MTDDYTTNKILTEQALSDIQKYLEDTDAGRELIQENIYLREYILNLECDIELTKTLAEEERKPIIEITHNENEE